MGEFELIRKFFAAAPCAQGGEGIALGIGDDCALLALPAGEQLAISTDTLVAGVHFRRPVRPVSAGSAFAGCSGQRPGRHGRPSPRVYPCPDHADRRLPIGCNAMPKG